MCNSYLHPASVISINVDMFVYIIASFAAWRRNFIDWIGYSELGSMSLLLMIPLGQRYLDFIWIVKAEFRTVILRLCFKSTTPNMFAKCQLLGETIHFSIYIWAIVISFYNSIASVQFFPFFQDQHDDVSLFN